MSAPAGPHLGPAGLDRLRAALTAASFTVDGLADLLGPVALAALGRGETVPAERATRGGSPGETLARVFLLGRPEPVRAVDAALAPLGLAAAVAGGLVTRDGGDAVAAIDLRPYAADDAQWWVASDATVGRAGALRPDHVLGVGGASTTLAQATIRPPVATALDVGTGCGVQALHLARHAGRVAGSDTNPRALRFAAFTAALAGQELELLEGDLLAPVAGRRFDLIVSNPPFVIAPRARYAYRDSGRAGDDVCRELVAGLPGHLTDGGVAQLLANWELRAGEDWRERVAGWLAGSGCDAWVLQREVQDPAEYAELWLRDADETEDPARYAARYDEWLADFADRGVAGVGFGLITLRRAGADDPVLRLQELRHEVEQPWGPHVAAWLGAQEFLRSDDARLLGEPLRVAADVRMERVARVDDDGDWAVERQTLRRTAGPRWAGPIDDTGAAIVAACDGTRALGELLAAAGVPAEAGVAVARRLVEEGFLLPVRLSAPGAAGG